MKSRHPAVLPLTPPLACRSPGAPGRVARGLLRTVTTAGAWAFAALASVPGSALATPCGGIALSQGMVKPGTPLTIGASLSETDAACGRHIGAELRKRRSVRTVTVAVRLPDTERIAGLGMKAAQAWADTLVAGGMPAARISAVAPAAGREPAVVRITYTERKAARPVALMLTLSGSVRAGPATGELAAVAAGEQLAPGTWIETAPAASASMALADGSELVLRANTLLKIGALRLNQQLNREVKLELSRGRVDTTASPGGKGSRFEIQTRTGVAGVRGTSFRVSADTRGETRLETLTGAVELAGSKGAVQVGAGKGSKVTATGRPEAPRDLLVAPAVEAPLQGALPSDRTLRWENSQGAVAWTVRLARDAEFRILPMEHPAPKPAWSVPGDLPAGKWFWRVMAIDKDGFVGLPSRIYAFQVPPTP